MTNLETTLITVIIYLFVIIKLKNRKVTRDVDSFDSMPNELIIILSPLFLLYKILQNIYKFILNDWYI